MLHFKNAIQSIPIPPVRDIGDAIYRERSCYLSELWRRSSWSGSKDARFSRPALVKL